MLTFIKFLGTLILFIVSGFLALAGIVYINKEGTNIGIYFLIIGFPLFILSVVLFYRFSRRCKKCKKWGVMEKIPTETVSEKTNYVFDNYETKNSTKFEQRKVKDVKYKYSKRCKNCGYIHSHIVEKEIIY